MIGYLLAFVFLVNVGKTISNERIEHIISLQEFITRRNRWNHHCWGSIVGDEWVVIATHCIDRLVRQGCLIL
ncbi:hypothetical protein DPMN_193777 [Dreissena polymorpha]|uniref:Peptidase S1 domain-containing protein n=1 Tax=Dreissena polymorpha TaxID=45954 RepID=A0A9D3Y2Q3_DREPO|nr:hypothetical protein DPMN_193777 [Dreissena polymorpha]